MNIGWNLFYWYFCIQGNIRTNVIFAPFQSFRRLAIFELGKFLCFNVFE